MIDPVGRLEVSDIKKEQVRGAVMNARPSKPRTEPGATNLHSRAPSPAVCVCVCVRACAYACVRACVCWFHELACEHRVRRFVRQSDDLTDRMVKVGEGGIGGGRERREWGGKREERREGGK